MISDRALHADVEDFDYSPLFQSKKPHLPAHLDDSAVGNISKTYVDDSHGPPLLDRLLTYKNNELRNLGVLKKPPGDPRRLAVYRNMFDAFIEEFKTYSPILSDIKNEYERSIGIYKKLAEEIQPLKDALAFAQHQAACEVAKTSNQVQAELVRLSEMEIIQTQRIEILENELKMSREENSRAGKELGKHRPGDNDTADGHLSDILIDFQDKVRVYERSLADSDREVFELKGERDKLQLEVQAHLKEMEKMKEIYKTAVPVSSLEIAEERIRSLQQQLSVAQANCEDLIADQQSMIEAHKKSLTERALFQKRMEAERFPDWEFIKTRFPAEDIGRFEQMAKGLDSVDTITILLHEVIKSKSRPVEIAEPTSTEAIVEDAFDVKYFMGLGVSSEIPKYLRYKGRVPNRRLTKRNMILLIRDIWAAKIIYESSARRKGNITTLGDFLYQYLKKRFGSQETIAEWGYNLLEAGKRYYSSSIECKIFYDVIKGNKEEEVYHRLQQTVERLKSTLYRLDLRINNGKAKGTLIKTSVLEEMPAFWGGKQTGLVSEESFKNALDADQPGVVVTYKWLFQSDSECWFLDLIRSTELALNEKLLDKFELFLHDSHKNTLNLTAVDYARAISRFDMKKKKTEVDMYVARGMGIDGQEGRGRERVDISTFMSNLRKGVFELAQA